MLSRPKPTSQHRHVIVDLSWPEGEAVNSPFSSSMYLSSQCHLQYPTVDQMVDSVVQAESQGQCYLFKIDLEQVFCNLRVDPLDYRLLGLFWNDRYYIDSAIPFGLIFGSFFCQKTIDANRHIMHSYGFTIYNYSDLIAIHSSLDQAQAAYNFLLALLKDLGLPVSANKLTPPARWH